MCLLVLNDRCVILSCRTAINAHYLNITLLEKWPFTEVIFIISSRDRACFALGTLKLLLPVGISVFTNITCCFLGL